MRIDRKHVEQTFADYTAKYDASDEKIKLKIDHTYRVAMLCDKIAENQKLSPTDRELAWLIGMLHDVGRFEQVRRFGTFADAESVDHAQFGADLLFGGRKDADKTAEALLPAQGDGAEKPKLLAPTYVPDILAAENAKERALVELAIRSHSAYRIPEGLTEREQLFCNIIRDADKIDILKVNMDTPLEAIYNVTTKQLKSCSVTPEVMQAFEEEHAVLRALKKAPIDHLVGHISLVYELVFDISLKIVAEQGYLTQMMHFESDNAVTKTQFQHIQEKMTCYLKKHLENANE